MQSCLYILELCHTWPAVTPLTLLELCHAWPAVTPPTLLELCHAWPAVTPPTSLELWHHGCKAQSAPTTTVRCTSSLHAYSYIQQSGRSIKSMNAKNTKKSPIHENADANITCYFGDGDISRSTSRLPHTHGQPVGSIIVRLWCRGKDIQIIRNLYWEQTESARIMNELSDEIRIQRGVSQGCIASPTIYTEKVFWHINMKSVNVGGKNYNNLRYMLMTPHY